jgi:DNA-binding NtrC family response regulator
LYFRLNVVPLELPKLSHRTEDIESLIEHFLSLFEKAYTLTAPKFSQPALKALKDYPWPGNIRELRNLCERLCILLAGRIIETENLPPEFINKNHRATQPADSFKLPEYGIQLDSVEAHLISQALDRTQGNRSKSAKLLGITRDTLLYRMQKHGFETSDYAA